MSPITALLITDGRPGHYHLAEGVIAGIARRRPVETVRLEVRRRFVVPGRALSALIRAGVPAERILGLGYGLAAGVLPAKVNVIVSAGGNTLGANVAARRLLGVPNIFYGSLRTFRPEDFSLVLTSHAGLATRPNQVMTLKPAPIDPDTLGSLARHAGPPRTAGLLVGGPTATILYSARDWEQLETFLIRSAREAGTRWIASNSRRTPREATAMLARLAALPDGPMARFIDVASAGPGTLKELFERSEAVLCTVDSSSMVSEAVWMRRPVIAIRPRLARLPANEADYRLYLEQNGWSGTLPIAELTPQKFASALAQIKALDANPLDRLAELLEEKLPGLFRDHGADAP